VVVEEYSGGDIPQAEVLSIHPEKAFEEPPPPEPEPHVLVMQEQEEKVEPRADPLPVTIVPEEKPVTLPIAIEEEPEEELNSERYATCRRDWTLMPSIARTRLS
jgi:hypothetical protein